MPNFIEIGPVVWISIPDICVHAHTHTHSLLYVRFLAHHPETRGKNLVFV